MAAPYKAPRGERARGGAALRGAVTPSVPPAVPAGSWPRDHGGTVRAAAGLLQRGHSSCWLISCNALQLGWNLKKEGLCYTQAHLP